MNYLRNKSEPDVGQKMFLALLQRVGKQVELEWWLCRSRTARGQLSDHTNGQVNEGCGSGSGLRNNGWTIPKMVFVRGSR